jgi:hypothetical protein
MKQLFRHLIRALMALRQPFEHDFDLSERLTA